MSTTSDRPNNPTTALWKECIAGWENIVRAFGHPIDLVRWGWMRALEHRALGHWLRDLEAIVRHAILSDALTREIPALRPSAHRADKRRAQPSSQEDMPRFRRTYSLDPTTWKVSFRMQARAAREADSRNAFRSPRKAPLDRRRCGPFAYRIEALRRAINYREDHVVRYVRRLARLAEASRPVSCAPLASKPVRALISYLPDTIATAIERILWSAKYVEPG